MNIAKIFIDMASNIVDNVFSEVCLDERITDGIFRMEEEAHMNALRDHFIKRGIPLEAAIRVTNRMLEGKFPDRQAWRKEDGILVTWPSPKHKAKAMHENPGKYVDKDPMPDMHRAAEPAKEKEPIGRREPEAEPKETPEKGLETEPRKVGNIFGGGESAPVTQNGQQLAVEPVGGNKQPVPQAPVATPVPRTPQRIAAEKSVVQQMFASDDNSMSNFDPSITETCRAQLNELYKKADEMGLNEAVTFLTKDVKP